MANTNTYATTTKIKMLSALKIVGADTKRVVIGDYSSYKDGLDNNGGCYSYKTFYDLCDDGSWQVSYWCSSDIGGYCEKQGTWCGNYFPASWCQDCGYNHINIKTLARRIKDVRGNADFSITFK